MVPARMGPWTCPGKVLEWLADWYDVDYYQDSPASNPSGPASEQELVSRGGAWATRYYYLHNSPSIHDSLESYLGTEKTAQHYSLAVSLKFVPHGDSKPLNVDAGRN